jgi:hypothetical protein
LVPTPSRFDDARPLIAAARLQPAVGFAKRAVCKTHRGLKPRGYDVEFQISSSRAWFTTTFYARGVVNHALLGRFRPASVVLSDSNSRASLRHTRRRYIHRLASPAIIGRHAH